MVQKKRKRAARKLPRLALLDSSKLDALCKTMEAVADLAEQLREAVPMLAELASVNRELLAITGRMHAADAQRQADETAAAAERRDRAFRAVETRRRNAAAAAPTPTPTPAPTPATDAEELFAADPAGSYQGRKVGV